MTDEGNGVKAGVAIPSPTKHTEMITQKTDASPVLRVENNPRSQPPADGSTNGTRVAAPRRSRIGRHLESQAAAGTWTPWAEFVDTLRVITKGRPRTDLTADWCAVKSKVLAELTALELEAEVWRVDRTVPLAEHDADLAGLVRIRPANCAHTAPDLSDLSPGQRDYAGWMAVEHGLTAHEGLPRTLLGLVGQHPGPPLEETVHAAITELPARVPPQRRWDAYDTAIGLLTSPPRPLPPAIHEERLAWFRELRSADPDRYARDYELLVPALLCGGGEPLHEPLSAAWLGRTWTWLDRDGLPVLTCEPRHLDAEEAAQAVAQLRDLSLICESISSPRGPATVLRISWAVDAQPVPAIAETPLPLTVRRVIAQASHGRHLIAA